MWIIHLNKDEKRLHNKIGMGLSALNRLLLLCLCLQFCAGCSCDKVSESRIRTFIVSADEGQDADSVILMDQNGNFWSGLTKLEGTLLNNLFTGYEGGTIRVRVKVRNEDKLTVETFSVALGKLVRIAKQITTKDTQVVIYVYSMSFNETQ